MSDKKIKFVVVNEHTLGCVHPDAIINEAEILRGSILRGAALTMGTILLDYAKVRPATRQDFETYGVSIEGYDKNPEYEEVKEFRTIYTNANWKIEVCQSGAIATNVQTGKYYHCAILNETHYKEGRPTRQIRLRWDYDGLHGNLRQRTTPAYIDAIIETHIESHPWDYANLYSQNLNA